MKYVFRIIGVLILIFTLSSCDLVEEVEEVTFDVSFVLPVGLDPIEDMKVVEGELLTLPEIDDLDSYQWYEDADHEHLFDDTMGITKDITLYLGSDTFDTIEYRGANKFFYDNLYETKVNIYDPNQVTHLVPELEGHTFIGWYHDKEFTQSLEDHPFVNLPEAQNYKVYAKYEINTHTFTKIVNEEVIYQMDIEYGKPLDLYYQINQLGYTFDGWYLDQELVTDFDLFLMPDEDVTLYGEKRISVNYTSFTSYDLMFDEGQQREFVQVTGIVTSNFMNNVFITDGIRAIKVESVEPYDIGTKIRVVGVLNKTVTSMTISNILESEVIDTDLENPLSLTTSTIADIISTDETLNDYMGYQFTVTGRLQFNAGKSYATGSTMIGISDSLGNHIELHFADINMYQEVIDLAGYVVTLDIIIDDYYGGDLRGLSKQTIEEIVIIETKGHQESLTEDVAWIQNYLNDYIVVNGYGYSMPRFGSNGSSVIFKSWSHPEYFNDRYAIISDPENGLIISLTIELIKGDLTQEVTHQIRVVESLYIEEMLDLETSRYVALRGNIYEIEDDGIYINYGNDTLFVDTTSINHDFVIGDFIEVAGLWENDLFTAFDSSSESYLFFPYY